MITYDAYTGEHFVGDVDSEAWIEHQVKSLSGDCYHRSTATQTHTISYVWNDTKVIWNKFILTFVITTVNK